MELSSPGAHVFCPGGRPRSDAFDGTRQLGVVAHADDLEICAIKGILDCFELAVPAFSGVVICDGVGAPGQAGFAGGSDDDYRRLRWDEQERAATHGRYAAVVGLGHPSSDVKARREGVGRDLDALLREMTPEVVYTHNPVDAHDTHVAVAVELVEAIRRMPKGRRPNRVIGCEVWRDLDWLPQERRVVLDVGAHPALQQELIGMFSSQTAGKRYDLAALGRRRAHATFLHADREDTATGLVLGVDLTTLCEPGAPSVEEFSLELVDEFRRDVRERFARLRGGP